jgi:hypothetical protein
MWAYSARFNLDELVVVAWNRIAFRRIAHLRRGTRRTKFIESSSRVTACHRSVSHRVVAHGGGLKTQPRFAQDLKMPQLRQQAANSA